MSQIEIPGFEILGKIGEGGMASVWKARQISLDRVVAVKLLPARLSSVAQDVERFQAEAKAAARLKHNGIVQVHDASFGAGLCYFVMEFVDGYTVGEWLRRKGVLPESDALLVAECVADALGYAWSAARIIHCDIKPENVMVDADGTVKVADLGLARTISAMSAAVGSDEVTGTPAYMSPEQVAAKGDLDCRADMYSLGAMLYHLLTGRMLFEGETEDRIMAQQIEGTVENPYDLNPKLSRGICRLIEKLLAKDPARRPPDWESVRADIAHVRKGISPLPLPADAASTVRKAQRQRTGRRKLGEPAKEASHDAPSGIAPKVVIAVAGAVALLLVTAISLIARSVARRGERPPARPTVIRPVPQPQPPRPPPPRPQGQTADDRARDIYESARQWEEQHPRDYREAARRYEWACEQVKGTKYEILAKGALDAVKSREQSDVAAMLDGLRQQAGALAEAGRHLDAARLLEEYSGPLAAESLAARRTEARGLREKHRDSEQARKEAAGAAARRFDAAVDEAARRLLEDGIAAGREPLRAVAAAADMSAFRDRLGQLVALLDAAEAMDRRILDSFRKQVGLPITVQLKARTVSCTVTAVEKDTVVADIRLAVGQAKVTQSFGVEDLAPREKLLRMGADDVPEVALAKGLMAAAAHATESAARYFAGVGGPLGERLAARVTGGAAGAADPESEARDALVQILLSEGVTVGEFDAAAWAEAVSKRVLLPDSRARAARAAAKYRSQHGSTAFCTNAAPVLEALEGGAGLAPTPPAPPTPDPPQPPAPPVSRPAPVKVPAEFEGVQGNADAVVKLLRRRNPWIEEKQISLNRDNDGKAVSLGLDSEAVEDIGPVAALPDLTSFACGTTFGGTAPIKDLSPLRGMRLEGLHVVNAKLADIEPLKGMPLRSLTLTGTAVKDISALRGMPLRNLDLAATRVFNFEALAGLPIESLNISGTQAKNIVFTRGMPLRTFHLADTGVFDFVPLSALPLADLNVSGTQIRDLGVLVGLPLSTLRVARTNVSDLSPLRGMDLKYLDVTATIVTDFTPIRAMKLVSFVAGGSRFEDIGILNGMQLVELDISGTKVSDLWALKGMPLVSLNINNTPVTDLGPLKDAPLRGLSCQGSRVEDFSPLAGSGIEGICIDRPETKMGFLRSLPALRSLNDEPFDPDGIPGKGKPRRGRR